MTDETPATPPPALPPAEDEVRRLLTDARHTGPIPPDVAARLDRVLTGLAGEPAREAPVVALAQRRRRATALLVAAAAVVAVGFGLNALVNPTEEPTAAEAGSAPRDVDEPASGQLREQADGLTSGEQEAPTSQDGAGAALEDAENARRGVVELQARDFSDQLLDGRALGSFDRQNGYFAYGLTRAEAVGKACRSDTWGPGTFVPVRYDGQPAVVVFRRPQGDTQVADLFLCGDTEPERSVTLPAP